MLVISKYKDYYDQILSHGVDKSILYKRELQEFFFKANQYVRSDNIINADTYEFLEYLRINLPYGTTRFDNKDYTAESFIIGFCGKIYIGYQMTTDIKTYESYNSITKIEFVYSVNDIITFFKKYNLTDSLEEFRLGKQIKGYYRKRPSKNIKLKFEEHDLKNVFDQFKENKFILDLFQQYKTPVFYLTHNTEGLKLVINPILKDYDFVSQVVPYTAGQEISMYISGVLGTSNPNIVQVSDKTKIEKAGFDKFSFRKEKL